MKAQINTHLFTQTRFDSGALSPALFVVHPFMNCGQYQADVYRNELFLFSFIIDVSEQHPEKQISVDLSLLESKHKTHPSHDNCCHAEHNRYLLSENGYALFYTSKGASGYSVKTHPLQGEKNDRSELFDSANLSKDDLFGLTLLRPGDYILREVKSKLECKLHVDAVKPGKTPYSPPDALHVDADTIKKSGGQLKLMQAQGLVIRCDGLSRIVIEYKDSPESNIKKPDVKNSHDKTAVARWRKAGVKR